MAYIGNQPTSSTFLTDQFSGTGSATAFTMTVAPANAASVLVVLSGVVQDPSTYSVSGLTLNFSAAPPAGTNNISVRYLGIPASGVTTTAYRTVTEFTATAGQTTFSVPSYTVGYIDVYRNGVRLGTADYTATSGTSVVLANAATLGDLVATESFYVSSVLNAIPATGGAINTIYLDAGNANGTGALLTPSGTTAQRPASPIVGMQRWNTTIGGMEVYIGNNNWQTVASTAYSVDYLVVAGGGAGGLSYAGGGGAGGLLQGSGLSVAPGTSYTITIGAGGAAVSAGVVSNGNNGGNSVFSSVATAIGGGGGGHYETTIPGSGGSGGGGGGEKPTAKGNGTLGQGNDGGVGSSNNIYRGGGGGGAGGAGTAGGSTTAAGGTGGIGLQSSISGTATYYAGGGGGGSYNASGAPAGVGGLGGGGAGAIGGTAVSGGANTGGGGGGAGGVGTGPTGMGPSGSGGSGVVIIRYLGTTQRATGGTVTITGGYVIHTFTSSGTFIA